MTAQAILHDLTTRGVRVWAESDRLKLDAPVGVVTEQDKQVLTAWKPELIGLLRPHTKPAREVVAELIALSHCPDGCGKLTLQDEARDVWFCPTCRLWVIAGVIQ
ncbi:MAG: hypothetical protein SF097_04605 [Acidobacteriota bacterium]|nr:hypothetical protein [Acidobacteriota bacterium]